MTPDRILQALAACNGGPGLTAAELAEQLHEHRAIVRNQLATLVFAERVVTCDREGRYTLGDPTALIEVRP